MSLNKEFPSSTRKYSGYGGQALLSKSLSRLLGKGSGPPAEVWTKAGEVLRDPSCPRVFVAKLKGIPLATKTQRREVARRSIFKIPSQPSSQINNR